MQRNSFLARLGGWLCLLGSVFALAAFFLPYWGSPPESLGHIFILSLLRLPILILSLFSPSPQPDALFGALALNAGMLALILPANALVAFAESLIGPPYPQKGLPITLKLPGMTLFLYCICFSLLLIGTWTDAQDPIQLDITTVFSDTLAKSSIGALLIPIGLLIALLGGMLAWFGNTRTAS